MRSSGRIVMRWLALPRSVALSIGLGVSSSPVLPLAFKGGRFELAVRVQEALSGFSTSTAFVLDKKYTEA